MKYEKGALSLEQQADQLIERGLIADRNELMMRLQAVNYYRLSGYLHPYRILDAEGKPTDEYKPDTPDLFPTLPIAMGPLVILIHSICRGLKALPNIWSGEPVWSRKPDERGKSCMFSISMENTGVITRSSRSGCFVS
jgi:hypothetical protein